jgi:conflict system STAND superfamily ATPase/bDLD-like protein/TIR domain-containing protein
MPDAVKVFVSYSHQDNEYLAGDSLLGFLKGLEKDGISFWTDREIRPGESWDQVIRDKLQGADIALVLVSQGFLDSDYCQNVEIKGFLSRKTHLFPVILSPCDWRRHAWLANRQSLPGGDRTIEEHYQDSGKRKRLFLEIREFLRERADAIRATRPVSPEPEPSSPGPLPRAAAAYSGRTKLAVCERLGADWKKLADRLDIPPADQARFERGDEGRWDLGVAAESRSARPAGPRLVRDRARRLGRRAGRRRTTGGMKYSGKTKPAFCERLGDEWKKVADFVEIPVSDQDGFAPGDQARAIWHWLERREASAKLADALGYVRRDDLVVLLEPEDPAVQSGGPTWGGCPYPGCSHSNPARRPSSSAAPGRRLNCWERLRQPDNRFLAVVGASGSGKSSLVKAGVIPQIEAKGGWLCTRLTPGEVGDDPFLAFATALKPLVQEQYDSVRQIHVRLTDSGDIGNLVRAALANQAAAELLVFIDEFEELFTLAAEAHRLPFTILLWRMASTPGLRTLVTLRADFYQRCLDYPHLTTLLRRAQASYPLHTPDMPALYEMITGPASAAGLCFDDGLVSRILRDTGNAPGALALMAFALHELYRASAPSTRLTLAAYEGFGVVQGAIGKRADALFDHLAVGAQQAFDSVFTELVPSPSAHAGP